MKSPTLALCVAGTMALASCAQPVRVDLPGPVQSPRKDAATAPDVSLNGETRRPTQLTRGTTPMPPQTGPAASGVSLMEGMPPLRGEPINVNIEGVPVPAFINEFFGTVLKVSFQMDPQVAKMSDLVTLRTSRPQSPQQFYELATRVLRTYGVATTYDAGRVYFTASGKGGGFEPPLVLSGRALPDVPITHRPVFQLVELQSVRTSDVNQWLRTAFKTDALEIQDDLNRNAVVLYGRPDIVRQAAAAIRVLDRPYMRGRASTRLEPAFVSADELSRRLVDVLVAEGYGASLHSGQGVVQASSVIVLPIASANTVLVFASDPAVLDHAVEWAQSIDRPNPTASGAGLFYYQVQNTRAEDLVATLNGVRQSTALASSLPATAVVGATPPPPRAGAAAPQASGTSTGGIAAGGQLVLDAPRNGLIFQGTSTEWGRLLPLVKQMDRAARQVMIEVTIAEVTLDNNEEFGVSWLAPNTGGLGRFGGTLTSGVIGGAVNSDGSAFTGLTYLLDVAGQARAQLKAYADDSKLTVLSTPRLMVKSGEEASIDVGTEVPTVTSQTAATQQTEGTSNLLQSIQYRKTGIILNIQPIVYSDNRIDLKVRQEVSEALPIGANDAVKSPSIFNRAVSTNLSLRDGSAILIGGLMSNRQNTGSGGVPLLKDIPVVGNLFKTQTRGNTRTELVLMIVPYIVETDAQAAALTRSIGERFEMIDVPASNQPPSSMVPSRPQAPPTP